MAAPAALDSLRNAAKEACSCFLNARDQLYTNWCLRQTPLGARDDRDIRDELSFFRALHLRKCMRYTLQHMHKPDCVVSD